MKPKKIRNHPKTEFVLRNSNIIKLNIIKLNIIKLNIINTRNSHFPALL